MPQLSEKQQSGIDQVAANMAIEDMQLDKQTYKYLAQIAAKEKTVDQLIKEIKKEYENG